MDKMYYFHTYAWCDVEAREWWQTMVADASIKILLWPMTRVMRSNEMLLQNLVHPPLSTIFHVMNSDGVAAPGDWILFGSNKVGPQLWEIRKDRKQIKPNNMWMTSHKSRNPIMCMTSHKSRSPLICVWVATNLETQ